MNNKSMVKVNGVLMEICMNNFFLVLVLLVGIFAHVARAESVVEIFVGRPTSIKPLSGIETIIYDLSLPEQVNAQYLPELPGDPAVAEKMAREFFASEKGKQFKDALKIAYRGQLTVARYQLKKIPAIVFEHGRYVVYGLTDLTRAHALYLNAIQNRSEDHHAE